MTVRNPFLQCLLLIGAATVLAIVANGFAAPTRRLVLPGIYPDALRVPKRAPDPPPTVTTAPVVVPTATTSTVVEMVPTSTATTATAPATQPETAPPATTTEAPPAPTPKADPLARFTPHPDKPYVELRGDDVALLYANGALFLDARRTSVYEEGHIAGARSFPVWEADIDDRVNALFEERSDPEEQNKPIVIYCSGGDCEDSHMLAQKLWGFQFNNVYVYKDGFPDWQKRGGAVRTGAQQ